MSVCSSREGESPNDVPLYCMRLLRSQIELLQMSPELYVTRVSPTRPEVAATFLSGGGGLGCGGRSRGDEPLGSRHPDETTVLQTVATSARPSGRSPHQTFARHPKTHTNHLLTVTCQSESMR